MRRDPMWAELKARWLPAHDGSTAQPRMTDAGLAAQSYRAAGIPLSDDDSVVAPGDLHERIESSR